MAHRIFETYDLCVCIAECLRGRIAWSFDVYDIGEDEDDCEDMMDTFPTLAALAQVSKSFSDPALDVLWSRLPDISPLGALLVPPEEWIDPDRVYALSEIPPERIERFHVYARRVRLLSFSEEPLHLSMLKTLSSINTPLLPQLSTILLEISPTGENKLLWTLLTPTITTLGITPSRPSERWLYQAAEFLSVLPKRSPAIRRLLFIHDEEDEEAFSSRNGGTADLGESIRDLPMLTYFMTSGPALSNHVLPILARAAHLEQLHLELTSDSPFDCSNLGESPFPVLRKLLLTGPPQRCTSLIAAFRPVNPPRQFNVLGLNFITDHMSPTEQQNFVHALYNSFGDTIEKIGIDSVALDSTILDVLFRCPNLTFVKIPIRRDPMIPRDVCRDSLLSEAYRAWPNLQEVVFSIDD
jgi:hypothetical protein